MWWFLWENWLLVLAVLAVVVAYIIGGWRLALGVASLGLGMVLYRQGHKDAQKEYRERADRIEEKRQDAYDEIDRRNTSGQHVRDRLRSGDY